MTSPSRKMNPPPTEKNVAACSTSAAASVTVNVIPFVCRGNTVNGRSTDKWLMKNKKDSSTSTLWIDKKLHFPVRTVTKDAQMDLTNIQEGEPSASLFEIPTGFRKFDMGAFAGGRPQSQ